MAPRILFLIGGEQIGGSETHLLRLIPHLRDFQIGVCCINGGSRFLDSLASDGVTTFDLRIPDLRRFSHVVKLGNLYRVLRLFRPDVIHSFGYTADLLGAVFSGAAGRPYIVGSRRGQDFNRRHQLLRSVANLLCDRVVCVSEATEAFVRRTEYVRNHKLQVIQNGVEPHIAHVLQRTGGVVKFGTLGRVMAVKGTDLLVDAFLKFNPSSNVELHIAGRVGDVWGEQLVCKTSRSVHAQKIKFVGFQNDPQAFLRNIDVFVLPSRSEGMSNALLEAMACGLPCIATDVGSNAALLRGKETAGLVCAPSVTELFECMAVLHESEHLRKDMGFAARRTVERQYSMRAMVNAYRQLYWDLLQPLNKAPQSASI
jgi:glycosyltransferase involved in cell wall biosynthesis